MRAFCVRLPSGARYWTVLDEDLAVVAVADGFLRQVRFGRDGAESTTKSYAHSIALFLRWCARSGRTWQAGAEQLALFMTWLAHAGPAVSGAEATTTVVVAGPGGVPARGARRINGVLTAVRAMVVHAVSTGLADGHLVSLLYEVADDRDMPEAARSGDGRMSWRMRARHRLPEPERPVDRAGDGDIVALLGACRSARDRLIVLLMARAGLRRGELCGLRRSDVHFLIVQAFDTYVFERMTVPAAAAGDFVVVNLFREPIGAPMRPDGIGELLAAASRRAGLPRAVTPHRLRHAFGSNAADAGCGIDVVADLLGHASVSSSQVYLHPDPDRLRAAVDLVPSPREQAAGVTR